jgi:hypothetical protein
MARRNSSGGGLLRTAERAGLRKGLNGSKPWFYVGTGLWTLRTVRRLAERKTEILVSETLEPGQRIIIANGRITVDEAEARGAEVEHAQATEKQSRRQRKAEAKRADKAAKKASKKSASRKQG